ncbi:unnamed protein product [Closterium sp. Yama58-4]|nr:unnamed protein product [Closterium sp. Yama58-4]
MDRSVTSSRPLHSAQQPSANATANVNIANNDNIIQQAMALLTALQQGAANRRTPPPEPNRPAGQSARAPNQPPPMAPDVNDNPPAALVDSDDEGNHRARIAVPSNAATALAPIPPARPQLRSALVKSDGIRTQVFSFERIELIARHTLAALFASVEGHEQIATY